MSARFAASMWIYTKAVVLNGQCHMQTCRISNMNSIMEAVNWVCEDAVDVHVEASEQSIALQEATVLEALQDDIEILCVVRCGMLWFSAPTPQERPVE